MLIRDCRRGEELALHAVFYSAVHTLGRDCYRAAELAAWAPASCEAQAWIEKIRALRPFVAADGERLVGYADLGEHGYIDQFYVAGPHARRGIGSALMRHLLSEARARALAELSADVSRCAEAFFARHGFVLIARRSVVLRQVSLANARMRRALA